MKKPKKQRIQCKNNGAFPFRACHCRKCSQGFDVQPLPDAKAFAAFVLRKPNPKLSEFLKDFAPPQS